MPPRNGEVQLGVTGPPAATPAQPDDAVAPHQRSVEIFGALADVLPYDQPVYRRTITTRPVTFTCAHCARTVTQQRFPGPRPRYCDAWCRRQAQRAQTRERVRQHRARARTTQDPAEG